MDDNDELTDWFPESVFPVMRGVYRIWRDDGAEIYAKWDGEYWMMYHGSVEAARADSIQSYIQRKKWRGLKHAPGR